MTLKQSMVMPKLSTSSHQVRLLQINFNIWVKADTLHFWLVARNNNVIRDVTLNWQIRPGNAQVPRKSDEALIEGRVPPGKFSHWPWY